jgi:hypothetical protein
MATALLEPAKLAWHVFNNLKGCHQDFAKFDTEINSLLVSIGSLQEPFTMQLIDDYIATNESKRREFRALMDGLNSVLEPFKKIWHAYVFALHQSQDNSVLKTSFTFDKQLKNLDEDQMRSKVAIQAACLNLFMTRLTQMQIQRQTELLTLRLAEQSILDKTWQYSKDLTNGKDQFRQDIARYIEYLRQGNKPLSADEIAKWRRTNPYDQEATKYMTYLQAGGKPLTDSDLMTIGCHGAEVSRYVQFLDRGNHPISEREFQGLEKRDRPASDVEAPQQQQQPPTTARGPHDPTTQAGVTDYGEDGDPSWNLWMV